MFPRCGDDGGDGLFDADVDDVVAVVAEDDIDQVFTDVVNVAFDGGNNHGALVAGIIGCLHVVFEVGDGVFHGFGGLEDEGKLHLAGAEEFTHGFHTAEKGLVGDEDIDRVEDVALIGKIPENREILKFIPYYYNVDNQERIADPFEMVGTRLEVYGNAISAPRIQVENVENILERLDISSNLYIPSAVSSARAVLTENQKENGVVIVDLGASTTGVVIFEDGNLQFIENIPLGGINITNDLAIGLKVSPEVAEEIKIKHGFAFEREDNSDIVVKHGREHYSFNTQEIDEIIEARVEEIFEEVRKVLRKSGLENQLPSGAVLTGGGAALKGIDTFAKKYLQLAVQISKNGIDNTVSEKVKTLEYSAAVGLLIEMRDNTSRYNSYRDEEPAKIGFFAKLFKKKQ